MLWVTSGFGSKCVTGGRSEAFLLVFPEVLSVFVVVMAVDSRGLSQARAAGESPAPTEA